MEKKLILSKKMSLEYFQRENKFIAWIKLFFKKNGLRINDGPLHEINAALWTMTKPELP